MYADEKISSCIIEKDTKASVLQHSALDMVIVMKRDNWQFRWGYDDIFKKNTALNNLYDTNMAFCALSNRKHMNILGNQDYLEKSMEVNTYRTAPFRWSLQVDEIEEEAPFQTR